MEGHRTQASRVSLERISSCSTPDRRPGRFSGQIRTQPHCTILQTAARILATFSLCALPCAASDAPNPAPPSQKIIGAARQILAEMKESHYSHETQVDVAAGIYDVDCSGLLCYLLRQVAPEHLAVVPSSKRHGRPLALQFFNTFSNASTEPQVTSGWRQIVRVADAQPGDVLVWRLEHQEAGKDTGHVMIVDDEPVADGDNLYRVRVIDSCGSPHSRDTRAGGTTGIGRGTMWFVVDNDGHPIGYHWKLRNGKAHDMEIAIGRAVKADHATDQRAPLPQK